MNKKVAAMIKEIERRGGLVGIHDALPDEVAESFLAQVLDCPDCRAAAAAADREEFKSHRRKPDGH